MGLIVGCGTLPVRLDAMDKPGYSLSLAGYLQGRLDSLARTSRSVVGLAREEWEHCRAYDREFTLVGCLLCSMLSSKPHFYFLSDSVPWKMVVCLYYIFSRVPRTSNPELWF